MKKKRENSPWARRRGKAGPPRRAPVVPRDVSAALLDLAAPARALLGGAASPALLEIVMLDTALLWNVAVYERVFDDPGVLERFLDSGAPPGCAEEFTEAFRGMLEAKRTEHPFDARWVISAAVVEEDDVGWVLRAESTRSDSLSREQAEIVIEALGSPWTGSDAPADQHDSIEGRGVRPPVAERGAAIDVWRALLETARSIHALRPWELHMDRDVFGLRVDGEDEVHWCSVMGAAGEFFGVALYRGAAGFGAFLDLAVEGDRESGLAGFDGFLVTFSDREELSAAERRRIKDAGVRFRGRGAWPQLFRQRSGRLAAELPDADAVRLLPLLDALAIVLELRGSEGIPEPVDLGGELPVYEAGRQGIVRRYEAPGPSPEEDPPPVDQVAVARVLRANPRTDLALEFDGSPAPARIADEDGLEYVPYLFLAAETSTGMLLEPRMCEVGERKAECASHLLALIASSEHIPREIHVASDWIERAIAPTTEALGVELVRRQELPGLEAVRAAFTSSPGFAP